MHHTDSGVDYTTAKRWYKAFSGVQISSGTFGNVFLNKCGLAVKLTHAMRHPDALEHFAKEVAAYNELQQLQGRVIPKLHSHERGTKVRYLSQCRCEHFTAWECAGH